MAAYFSLILPAYNVAPYLGRCIQSILDQDFSDCEVIIVDDGSTDETPRISDEYARKDDRIRVIHKENGGLSSARNAGTAQAEGRYIWWIDSDDWIEPGALSRLHRSVAQEQPDIVKFGFYRVEASKQPFHSCAAPGLYEGDQKTALLDQAFYTPSRFGLSAWSHLYRRDFLLAHPTLFVSERVVGSEDYLFTLSIYPHAQRMLVLEDQLYDYELRQGSLSQSYKKDLPQRYLALHRHLLDEYQKNGLLHRYQEAICSFYSWHLVRGTCLSYEYLDTTDHPIREGRKNVRALLRDKNVQQALRGMNPARLSRKDRVLYAALRLRMEPLLYWLYVVKPGLKKGK